MEESSSALAAGDGSWKVYLKPKPAGGQYQVIATSGSMKDTLSEVTFGDVRAMVHFCKAQNVQQMSTMSLVGVVLQWAKQHGRNTQVKPFLLCPL